MSSSGLPGRGSRGRRGEVSRDVSALEGSRVVVSYPTYAEAQRAVDGLSDREFAVQHVTIVGSDLRLVERVTGRLTYGRVALAGAASGAWFGLLFGLLFTLLSEDPASGLLLGALLIGAGGGALFGIVAYAATGGRRDFSSRSALAAGRYDVMVRAEHADEAERLIGQLG
ncbi:membrane protein [soil metagenome]